MILWALLDRVMTRLIERKVRKVLCLLIKRSLRTPAGKMTLRARFHEPLFGLFVLLVNLTAKLFLDSMDGMKTQTSVCPSLSPIKKVPTSPCPIGMAMMMAMMFPPKTFALESTCHPSRTDQQSCNELL